MTKQLAYLRRLQARRLCTRCRKPNKTPSQWLCRTCRRRKNLARGKGNWKRGGPGRPPLEAGNGAR